METTMLARLDAVLAHPVQPGELVTSLARLGVTLDSLAAHRLDLERRCAT